MARDERWTRRAVLGGTTSLGFAVVGPAMPVPAPGAVQGRPVAPRCADTPPDIEGPFYVAGVPVREELDLYGDVGARLTLDGIVVDTDCSPVEAAVVEIWHVGPNGNYDNQSVDMRYRGQTATAADGSYHFHTLMPVYYGVRPLHVHMKVWVGGVEKLTTQIYFEDDPKSVNQEPALVVPRTLVGADYESVFDVVIVP